METLVIGDYGRKTYFDGKQINNFITALHIELRKRFEPKIENTPKAFRAIKPFSVLLEIENPFIFSNAGRVPERIGEFKIEPISFGNYRVTKI